ncbi:hypothetical protein [Longimicrobium sp.]|uniref:hypothetical protein n=1 Tax=Longimicrobium sp. TaxID=2029185 RepID=UPI003B3BE78B
MKAPRKVPVWLLAAAGVSALVYRFARKQNRGERVGGPISLPKSLWLNYTLLSWFVIPATLLRRQGLSPANRAALQAHLLSFTARGAAEMWMLYRTHSWRCAYGVGHDAVDLVMLSVMMHPSRAESREGVNGVARRHLDSIRGTLVAEMIFASLFNSTVAGQTQGQDGIYFASDEPHFRAINNLTAVVDVVAYARLAMVMRDLVRLDAGGDAVTATA